MSERADALRAVLANDLPEAWNGLKWEQHEVGHYFRAICDHLGITWEMVDLTEHMPVSGQVALAEAGEMVDQKDAMRDALATLLEAAGIER